MLTAAVPCVGELADDDPVQCALTVHTMLLPLRLLLLCASAGDGGVDFAPGTVTLTPAGEQCLRVVELCSGCLFNCSENSRNKAVLTSCGVHKYAEHVQRLLAALSPASPTNVRLRSTRVSHCLITVGKLLRGEQKPSV